MIRSLSDLPKDEIVAFCEKWRIQKLLFFGSILRSDFNEASDLDILVEFEASASWGLIDHSMMESEISELLGRPVDFLTLRSVERSKNAIRRESILKGAKLYYEAA